MPFGVIDDSARRVARYGHRRDIRVRTQVGLQRGKCRFGVARGLPLGQFGRDIGRHSLDDGQSGDRPATGGESTCRSQGGGDIAIVIKCNWHENILVHSMSLHRQAHSKCL